MGPLASPTMTRGGRPSSCSRDSTTRCPRTRSVGMRSLRGLPVARSCLIRRRTTPPRRTTIPQTACGAPRRRSSTLPPGRSTPPPTRCTTSATPSCTTSRPANNSPPPADVGVPPSQKVASPRRARGGARRTAAWSKCLLGSAPAGLLCLVKAHLAALGSLALPGRGPATGRLATASGARASHLQSRRFHRL